MILDWWQVQFFSREFTDVIELSRLTVPDERSRGRSLALTFVSGFVSILRRLFWHSVKFLSISCSVSVAIRSHLGTNKRLLLLNNNSRKQEPSEFLPSCQKCSSSSNNVKLDNSKLVHTDSRSIGNVKPFAAFWEGKLVRISGARSFSLGLPSFNALMQNILILNK